jgi:hypothetical protein
MRPFPLGASAPGCALHERKVFQDADGDSPCGQRVGRQPALDRVIALQTAVFADRFEDIWGLAAFNEEENRCLRDVRIFRKCLHGAEKLPSRFTGRFNPRAAKTP